MSSFVVSCSNGLESILKLNLPLLTGSIPDLKFDAFVVDFQLSNSEIHADSGQETFMEDVVSEPTQDVSLSGATVADDKYLEDVVVLLVH